MPCPCRRFLACLLPALCCFLHTVAAPAGITGYRPASLSCRDASGTSLVAIRSFTSVDNLPSYLAINPQSLETRVVLATEVIPIRSEDTLEALAARVHTVEHRLLITVLKKLTAEKVRFPIL